MAERLDRMGIYRDDDVTDDARYGSLYLRKRNINNVNDYGGTNEIDAAKLANIGNAAAGSTCLFNSGDIYVCNLGHTWSKVGESDG